MEWRIDGWKRYGGKDRSAQVNGERMHEELGEQLTK